MRLVYTSDKSMEVRKYDQVTLSDGKSYTVIGMSKPKTPASSGRVILTRDGATYEYYPGVIGAEWIEREDRENCIEVEDAPDTTLVSDQIVKKYGWVINEYAMLKRDYPDELGQIVSAGTIIRIQAIAPRVYKTDKQKPFFLNACRIGDTYPRLRIGFEDIRRPTKRELTMALSGAEARIINLRLKA